MSSREFIGRIRKLGRDRRVKVRFDPRKGKGSHGRLYYAGRFTMMKELKKEISKGLIAKMLK